MNFVYFRVVATFALLIFAVVSPCWSQTVTASAALKTGYVGPILSNGKYRWEISPLKGAKIGTGSPQVTALLEAQCEVVVKGAANERFDAAFKFVSDFTMQSGPSTEYTATETEKSIGYPTKLPMTIGSSGVFKATRKFQVNVTPYPLPKKACSWEVTSVISSSKGDASANDSGAFSIDGTIQTKDSSPAPKDNQPPIFV